VSFLVKIKWINNNSNFRTINNNHCNKSNNSNNIKINNNKKIILHKKKEICKCKQKIVKISIWMTLMIINIKDKIITSNKMIIRWTKKIRINNSNTKTNSPSIINKNNNYRITISVIIRYKVMTNFQKIKIFRKIKAQIKELKVISRCYQIKFIYIFIIFKLINF
jgi:hypothetical protein